jgi:DNA gyrase subunit A
MENTIPEQQAQPETRIKIDANVLTYSEVLVFTTFYNAYKIQNNAFTSSAQILSQVLFEAGEKPIYMTGTSTYSGYLIAAFENGKVAKINFSSYETETKRKKLNSVYNNESKLIFIEHIIDDIDLVALSSINKVVLFNTSQINAVGSRTTKGFHAVKAKNGSSVLKVKKIDQVKFADPEYYRKGLNTVGYYLKPGDEF